jgi:hypothetical protein
VVVTEAMPPPLLGALINEIYTQIIIHVSHRQLLSKRQIGELCHCIRYGVVTYLSTSMYYLFYASGLAHSQPHTYESQIR